MQSKVAIKHIISQNMKKLAIKAPTLHIQNWNVLFKLDRPVNTVNENE